MSSLLQVRKVFHAIAFAVITTALSAPPATAQTPAVQTCPLGNLTLESDEVIKDFKMTYITFGTLNADKSNAIL